MPERNAIQPSAAVQRVLDQARTLSSEDRADLIDALVALPADPEVEAAWAAEVEDRIRAVEAGAMETYSTKEVFRELRTDGFSNAMPPSSRIRHDDDKQ